MSHIQRILTMPAETVFFDKYGGATFTGDEIAKMVAAMAHTDTNEDIDNFLERFEVAPAPEVKK